MKTRAVPCKYKCTYTTCFPGGAQEIFIRGRGPIPLLPFYIRFLTEKVTFWSFHWPRAIDKPGTPFTYMLWIVCFYMTSLKFKLKKLSILLKFYFHDALQQLKTSFHTSIRFKRVLGFVIEYAWISKLLRDALFTWRPRELSCRLKK